MYLLALTPYDHSEPGILSTMGLFMVAKEDFKQPNIDHALLGLGSQQNIAWTTAECCATVDVLAGGGSGGCNILTGLLLTLSHHLFDSRSVLITRALVVKQLMKEPSIHH